MWAKAVRCPCCSCCGMWVVPICMGRRRNKWADIVEAEASAASAVSDVDCVARVVAAAAAANQEFGPVGAAGPAGQCALRVERGRFCDCLTWGGDARAEQWARGWGNCPQDKLDLLEPPCGICSCAALAPARAQRAARVNWLLLHKPLVQEAWIAWLSLEAHTRIQATQSVASMPMPAAPFVSLATCTMSIQSPGNVA